MQDISYMEDDPDRQERHYHQYQREFNRRRKVDPGNSTCRFQTADVGIGICKDPPGVRLSSASALPRVECHDRFWGGHKPVGKVTSSSEEVL